MSFQIRPYPDFSWSYSRAVTFHECPRKYYYQYYGAHNGWLASAGEDVRTVYRLKQLTTLPIEVGGAIHDAARYAITRVRDGNPEPSFDELHERARGALNEAWLQSKERQAWENRPNQWKMFHDSYYGSGLDPIQIAEGRERLARCLTNLRTSESYRQALAAPVVEVRPEEFMEPLDIGGTPVYAVPDLHYRLGDGSWTVTDWKTGVRQQPDWDQVAVYTLFIRERYGAETVRARIEWLNSGDVAVRMMSAEDIDHTRETIAGGVAAMRGYLQDAEANEPRPREAFPLREDTGACPSCSYYELCQPEIAARASGGPF